MTSSPELPVPDAAVDAMLARLVNEDGWLPPRQGPTGDELDRYCGPDGMLNDAEGLRAADRAASAFNHESLRRAVAAAMAVVLRKEADRLAAHIPTNSPHEDSSFYWGVDEFADGLRLRADEIDPS